jgi:hypothetical protein
MKIHCAVWKSEPFAVRRRVENLRVLCARCGFEENNTPVIPHSALSTPYLHFPCVHPLRQEKFPRLSSRFAGNFPDFVIPFQILRAVQVSHCNSHARRRDVLASSRACQEARSGNRFLTGAAR